MLIAARIAKIGVITLLSSSIAKIVSPVTDVVGGTFATVRASVRSGNNRAKRSAELADITHQTHDVTQRMALKVAQRESLIQFGENTKSLRDRYDDLGEPMQEAIAKWENRFPEV